VHDTYVGENLNFLQYQCLWTAFEARERAKKEKGSQTKTAAIL
jgi:hypothetical protein